MFQHDAEHTNKDKNTDPVAKTPSALSRPAVAKKAASSGAIILPDDSAQAMMLPAIHYLTLPPVIDDIAVSPVLATAVPQYPSSCLYPFLSSPTKIPKEDLNSYWWMVLTPIAVWFLFI